VALRTVRGESARARMHPSEGDHTSDQHRLDRIPPPTRVRPARRPGSREGTTMRLSIVAVTPGPVSNRGSLSAATIIYLGGRASVGGRAPTECIEPCTPPRSPTMSEGGFVPRAEIGSTGAIHPTTAKTRSGARGLRPVGGTRGGVGDRSSTHEGRLSCDWTLTDLVGSVSVVQATSPPLTAGPPAHALKPIRSHASTTRTNGNFGLHLQNQGKPHLAIGAMVRETG
jgi:hypothetical protein